MSRVPNPGQGKQVNLRPAAGWLDLALEQLGVKPEEVACLPTVHKLALVDGSRDATNSFPE